MGTKIQILKMPFDANNPAVKTKLSPGKKKPKKNSQNSIKTRPYRVNTLPDTDKGCEGIEVNAASLSES